MPIVLRPTVAEIHDEIPGDLGRVHISLIHGEFGWEASLSLGAHGHTTEDKALAALVTALKAFLALAEGGMTLGPPRRPEPVQVARRET